MLDLVDTMLEQGLSTLEISLELDLDLDVVNLREACLRADGELHDPVLDEDHLEARFRAVMGLG